MVNIMNLPFMNMMVMITRGTWRSWPKSQEI